MDKRKVAVISVVVVAILFVMLAVCIVAFKDDSDKLILCGSFLASTLTFFVLIVGCLMYMGSFSERYNERFNVEDEDPKN